LLPPPQRPPLLFGGGGGGLVIDEMLLVKRSTLETTRLERPSKPPTMVLANAAPGSVGIVGVPPVPLVADGRGPVTLPAGCGVGEAEVVAHGR